MVGKRRHEDTGDDGPGLAQSRGENEGKQLSLVADFGNGNQQGGSEEGFQVRGEAAENDAANREEALPLSRPRFHLKFYAGNRS